MREGRKGKRRRQGRKEANEGDRKGGEEDELRMKEERRGKGEKRKEGRRGVEDERTRGGRGRRRGRERGEEKGEEEEDGGRDGQMEEWDPRDVSFITPPCSLHSFTLPLSRSLSLLLLS